MGALIMNKVINNFIYQAVYQMTLVILPIITIPLVSRVLGPGGVGTWNFMQSIMNYFLLISGLGLANYGVREIALATGNKKKLSEKFWELTFFNMFFCLITIIIYFIFILFLSDIKFFVIQSFILFGAFFDISWFFSGLEDFKKITLISIFCKLVGFFSILIFVKTESDLSTYIFIQSITIFLSQLSMWLFLRDKIFFIVPKTGDIFKHFGQSMRFFIAKLSSTIYMNMTKTILGILGTMSNVGFYSNALSLITLSGSLITALNTVLIPRMSNLFDKDNEEKIILKLEMSLTFQLLLTIPMMFGLVLISDNLVSWFFGNKFAGIEKIIKILSPFVVFQSLQSGIAAQYLIPKNDMNSYNKTVLISAVISLISNIAFIPLLGIYGAVLSTLIGQSTLCFVRLYVLMKETRFKFNYYDVVKFFLASTIMYYFVKILTKNFSPTIFTTFIQIILAVLLYFILIFLLKTNIVKLIKNEFISF